MPASVASWSSTIRTVPGAGMIDGMLASQDGHRVQHKVEQAFGADQCPDHRTDQQYAEGERLHYACGSWRPRLYSASHRRLIFSAARRSRAHHRATAASARIAVAVTLRSISI